MDIKSLVKLFYEKRSEGMWSTDNNKDDNGMRAVVKALRDEVVLKIDAHASCGILATETAIDATRDVFNDIFGEKP